MSQVQVMAVKSVSMFTYTQVFGFLPLFKRRQYSYQAVSVSHENEKSTVIPFHMPPSAEFHSAKLILLPLCALVATLFQLLQNNAAQANLIA